MSTTRGIHSQTPRQEYSGPSELVIHPMRDGLLGRSNPQPCDPRDRTHWLIVGIIGPRDSDWVPLHDARGTPALASPESELVHLLQCLELPVTIDLHPDRIGPCATLKELTEALARFIQSDTVEHHPLSASQLHSLTPLHATLALAVFAQTHATDPGKAMFR